MLCLNLSIQAFSQDKEATKQKYHSLQDTTIALAYFQKAEVFAKASQYDSSNYYFEEAIKVYESLGENYSDEIIWSGIIKCKNEIGWNLMLLGKYDSSLWLLNETLHFAKERFGENSIETARTYNNIGVVFWQQGEYHKAIDAHKKSLSVSLSLLGEINSKVSSSYNNLGIIYFEMGDLDRALEYYKKSMIIDFNLSGELSPNTDKTYNNVGNTYSRKGDNFRALEYYKKSLSIRRELLGDNHPDVATSYSNIGIAYGRMGDYEKALENNLIALSIRIDVFKTDHPDIAMSYNNIGLAYFHLGDYEQGKKYAEKSLAIKINLLGEKHRIVLSSYIFLGDIHSKLSEYELAIDYYNKALIIGIDLFGQKHHYVGECYYLIAKVYEQMNEYEKAILFCQKSLLALVPDFDDQNIQSNPEIKNINPGEDLLNTLDLKAKLFLKADTGNLNNIIAAHSIYRLAIDVIDKMRTGYKSEGSKLFIIENSTKVYDKAIQCALKLYQETEDQMYKQQAFILAEKSKAAVLQEALAETDAKQFSGLPADLIEEEKQLKIDLAFCETQLQKEYQKKDTKDSVRIGEYENRLFDLKEKYFNMVSNLEMTYPNYYNLKYQTKTISVEDIQKHLPENALLVEYFTGESSIFIFLISVDHFEIIEVEKHDNFSKIVKNFYSSILKSEVREYISSGNTLSKLLIHPVLEKAGNAGKLIIVPHDILYKIPFEALFTSIHNDNEKDYTKLNYVVKDFDVSYHYSTSLFVSAAEKVKSHPAGRQKNFAGFAPVFPETEQAGYTLASKRNEDVFAYQDEVLRSSMISGNKFSELKYSKWEVESIMGLVENRNQNSTGIAYFYSDATESKFKEGIKDFDIIHIATHSFINDAHPQLSGIVFAQTEDESDSGNDGILYSAETYNLDLNANLVVLSSCESGLGKIVKGEGMMALTRGFLYSGADNILFSLWKVPDKHTSELMIEFYGQHFSGSSYSESLRAAKLKLIGNQTTARPRSWASFILIGAD